MPSPSQPIGLSPGTSVQPGTLVSTLTPTLTWAVSTDTDTYSVALLQIGGSPVSVLPVSMPAHSTTPSPLMSGATYEWSVTAIKGLIYSSPSAAVFFNVLAVPTGLAIEDNTTLTPVLTWNKVTGAASYEVTIDTGPLAGGVSVCVKSPAGTSSFNCPALPKIGWYNAVVYACNEAGVAGDPSSIFPFQIVSPTPPVSAPPTPSGLSPGSASQPGTSITTLTPTLTWVPLPSAANEYTYAVAISQVGSPSPGFSTVTNLNPIPCPINPLQNGATYSWSVTVVNAAGVSSSVSPLSFFTVNVPVAPVAPTGLTPGSPGTASYPVGQNVSWNSGWVYGEEVTTMWPVLTWDVVPGATGYSVSLSQFGWNGKLWPFFSNVLPNSIVCPALGAGVYQWSVTAYNAEGSNTSETMYFAVVLQRQSPAPTGLSPGGPSQPGPIVYNLTPTLMWVGSAAAGRYFVNVQSIVGAPEGFSLYCENPNSNYMGIGSTILSPPTFSSMNFNNSVVCPKLTAGVTYQWSVMAGGLYTGDSGPSQVLFFTVL